MASLREIKRRKERIQTTQQITNAMKLVSTAKLQKAKARAEIIKPYFDKMQEEVVFLLKKSELVEHPYLKEKDGAKNAVILISGNRGLAGGYNQNVVRAVLEAGLNPNHTVIYGIGKNGVERMRKNGYKISFEKNEMVEEPKFEDAVILGRILLDAYENGEIGRIYLAYTRFQNTVVHIPVLMQLLPVTFTEDLKKEKRHIVMDFEPSAEEVLEQIVPQYINSLIYGALIEAAACENGARMQAMDSATSNAKEIIDTLSLAYNRARQGTITQELTEIISGAEALG